MSQDELRDLLIATAVIVMTDESTAQTGVTGDVSGLLISTDLRGPQVTDGRSREPGAGPGMLASAFARQRREPGNSPSARGEATDRREPS